MTGASRKTVTAIVQARMSSTRLPGKVLQPIIGKPMLSLQLERISRSRLITHICVATSTDSSDDAIADLCRDLDIDYFRGSLSDVLDRFYQASQKYTSDLLVRLTGDCPLCDPEVIDTVTERALSGPFDYVSNCLRRTYPVGLDTEVFTPEALETVHREARLPSEREHVTPYIYNHPEKFLTGNVACDRDLSHHRWTVDEPDDLTFVAQVFEHLYHANANFNTRDILQLLTRKPDLATINYHIVSGRGSEKSLSEEESFLVQSTEQNTAVK
jgi:spore coat polysaccharide biosynthesis protein SpsF (cytidylyltransferase family)